MIIVNLKSVETYALGQHKEHLGGFEDVYTIHQNFGQNSIFWEREVIQIYTRGFIRKESEVMATMYTVPTHKLGCRVHHKVPSSGGNL